MSGAATTPATPGFFQRLIDSIVDVMRDPNPILVKELRSIFRTNLFIRFLYLSTGVIGVVVLGGGAMVASGPIPPAQVGQIVFQIFFSTALLIICLIAPAYAATAITAEREMRTYESLILSGMKPWRIVRGKFLAAYAAMFLVLVAQAPVVGIAFLFGGISPWHVVIGYAALLVALAPAIALGVAVSARISSTRIAILIAIVAFVPTAFFVTIMVTALGEPARTAWGLAMQGPFWFTEAIANRIFEPDTIGLCVLLPAYVFGIPVWLLLASAVAGIKPAAEDRSTPFKWWALAAAFGLIAICGLAPLVTGRAEEVGMSGVIFDIVAFFPLLFIAMVFMNEPPLPPRLFEQRMRSSKLGFIGRAIGPGAAPTLRFSAFVLIVTAMLIALAPIVTRHFYFPAWKEHAQYDLGLVVIGVGHAAVLFFFVSMGTAMRVFLRNGVAARILAIAVIATISLIPFLFTAILDPASLERLDDEIPFLIQLSPVAPSIYAVDIASAEIEMTQAAFSALPAIIYGGLGALFWIIVEIRVAHVTKLDRELRARREQRSRTSEPPLPILQRKSRPSLTPPAPEPESESASESESESASESASVSASESASESASTPAAPGSDYDDQADTTVVDEEEPPT